MDMDRKCHCCYRVTLCCLGWPLRASHASLQRNKKDGALAMMLRILTLLLSTMLLIAIPAGAQEEFDRNSPEFRESTSQFMCLCGCGQDHHECDMEACG